MEIIMTAAFQVCSVIFVLLCFVAIGLIMTVMRDKVVDDEQPSPTTDHITILWNMDKAS